MEDQEAGEKLDTDGKAGSGIGMCRASYPTVAAQHEEDSQPIRETERTDLTNHTNS